MVRLNIESSKKINPETKEAMLFSYGNGVLITWKDYVEMRDSK